MKLKKDAITNMIRSIIANTGLMVPLKNFIRNALGVDNDHSQGLRWQLVFTCTLVPAPIRDSEKEQLLLQISRVDKHPIDWPEDVIQECTDPPSGGMGVLMTFVTDIPGARSPIFFMDFIWPEMLRALPAIPFPVIWIG